MKKLNWPSWPNYGEEEEAAVARVIRSNQLFAANEVKSFEREFAEYVGSKHALGVGNATQGLHLALAALGVGVGHEVIVTPYSWISSASCALMQNAVPVFVDCEEETLGLCPKAVEAAITSHTRAIVLVHMFGYPSNAEAIEKIAEKHNIPIVEDASHAHGMEINGRRAGRFGKLSVFSLHQRKAISTGDGGVVTTDDSDIAAMIYRLRSFGDAELSYNYRMSEFSAALGRVGIGKLDAQNKIRVRNAELLAVLLERSQKISVRRPRLNGRGVYYSALLELTPGSGTALDDFVERANQLGLPLKRTWAPLHRHTHFNPSQNPARGLPWCDPRYTGSLKNITGYFHQKFPVIEDMCDNRIVELAVHPPVDESHIRKAAKIILGILDN